MGDAELNGCNLTLKIRHIVGSYYCLRFFCVLNIILVDKDIDGSYKPPKEFK